MVVTERPALLARRCAPEQRRVQPPQDASPKAAYRQVSPALQVPWVAWV